VQEVTTIHGGLTLDGVLNVPERHRLSDGVVLMTHGTFAHNRMRLMTDLQHLLGARGLSTLAITLSLGVDRRRGMYECARPHHHLHTDSLDEIGAWLEWLRDAGAENITLLGHSRGGNQTAWFTSERLSGNDDIKAVVLMAPMTWSGAEAHEFYQEHHGIDIRPVIEQAKSMDGDQMLEDVPFLFCPATTAAARSYLSYHGDEPRLDTPSLMAGIRRPLLVVSAENDEIMDDLPTRTEEVARAGLELVVIPDADHFFKGPFAVQAADAVADFLSEL
jgi:pimeloyl-ACP methyl ester carboxylesterase